MSIDGAPLGYVCMEDVIEEGFTGHFTAREVLPDGLCVELDNSRRYVWRWQCDASFEAPMPPDVAAAGRRHGMPLQQPLSQGGSVPSAAGLGFGRNVPAWMECAGIVVSTSGTAKAAVAPGEVGASSAAAVGDAAAQVGGSAPEDADTSCAGDWEEYVDPETGNKWWWHEASNTVSWEPPS